MRGVRDREGISVRLLPTHLEVDEMYSAFLIENDLEQDCFFVGGVDSFEIARLVILTQLLFALP